MQDVVELCPAEICKAFPEEGVALTPVHTFQHIHQPSTLPQSILNELWSRETFFKTSLLLSFCKL